MWRETGLETQQTSKEKVIVYFSPDPVTMTAQSQFSSWHQHESCDSDVSCRLDL